LIPFHRFAGLIHAMFTVAAVVEFLEQLAPPVLAADWDNVGLLLGDPAAEVQRIMTCLTVTPESVVEALESGAQLIVAHHPILFHPVQRLTSATPEGRMLLGLIRAGVAVYSPHTAFDNANGGINDILAARLELRGSGPLRGRRRTETIPLYKLVVFVPDADLARVSEALFAAGAGSIGQYSQCSFRVAGTGTFFGSDSTHPAVGQKGRREEVSEWRLEAVCPETALELTIDAMRRAHSYEEPAYDVYPLHSNPAPRGEGRLGKLPQPMRLSELARTTKTLLKCDQLQLIGNPDSPVEKVAIVCGAGGGLLMDAVHARADVLITGELRFHHLLAAQANGLSLLLPGHYATERLGMEELAIRLRKQWPDLQIWASQRERDPVQWL
jgi:dinuclear metal center YbgI/SA1388 family protein